MISKIRVTFQNHRLFEAELDPCVSVFVGPSAAGKSSILRAIRWALTNKPLGQAFIGKWGKMPHAIVRLEIDDHVVVRKKGSGTNIYKLDGNILKAFGADPPIPIQDLVNVDTINFQGQHDGPFWFSLTPSQISKAMNGVINLGSIDRALAKANSHVRQAKATVAVSKDRLRTSRSEMQSYQWAVRLSKEVNRVSLLFDDLATVATELRQIDDLVKAMSEVTYRLYRAVAVHELAQIAGVAAQKAEKLRIRLDRLSDLISKLRKMEIIARMEISDAKNLRQIIDQQKVITRKIQRLDSLIFGIDGTDWEIEDYKKSIKELEKQLSKTGKRCPTCNQILPSSQTSTLVTSHPHQEENQKGSGIPVR